MKMYGMWRCNSIILISALVRIKWQALSLDSNPLYPLDKKVGKPQCCIEGFEERKYLQFRESNGDIPARCYSGLVLQVLTVSKVETSKWNQRNVNYMYHLLSL
jgi:hypothetical protein